MPANSAADWTTWEDWGSGGGGGVCVCWVGGGRGRDEAISKLKGAGATRALPRSYLHVSCSLDCLTKANPDGISGVVGWCEGAG